MTAIVKRALQVQQLYCKNEFNQSKIYMFLIFKYPEEKYDILNIFVICVFIKFITMIHCTLYVTKFYILTAIILSSSITKLVFIVKSTFLCFSPGTYTTMLLISALLYREAGCRVMPSSPLNDVLTVLLVMSKVAA